MAKLPGFVLGMLMVDFMHSDLGCWISGNTLVELVASGRFGYLNIQAWTRRHELALRAAWIQFRAWAKANKVSHSVPCFNPARLSMASVHDWPELKGKSHNIMMVTVWLWDVVRPDLPNGDVHDKLRGTVLQAYVRIRNIITHAGLWLTADEAQELLDAGKLMLNSYKLLSWDAAPDSSPRWPLKPKHHHIDEGIRNAFKTRRNPRTHWLFKHEDFVGKEAKLVAKSHTATCGRRALERWVLRVALETGTPSTAAVRPKYSSKGAMRFRRFPRVLKKHLKRR